MSRTFCLIVLLGIIVCWTVSNISEDHRFITSLFIILLLFIPGRISQYFYQDFYKGRKYLDKDDLDKALYCFLKFEHCIEEKPWKKIILWMTWSIYTIDVLAMVKNNISTVYIRKE